MRKKPFRTMAVWIVSVLILVNPLVSTAWAGEATPVAEPVETNTSELTGTPEPAEIQRPNAARQQVAVLASPSMFVDMTRDITILSDDGVIRAGDILHLSFGVTNSGDVPLRDVELTGSIGWEAPPTPGLIFDGETTFAVLEPGESRTVSATYVLTASDIEMLNSATCAYAKGYALEGRELNTSSCSNLSFAVPVLVLEKTANVSTNDPAGVIHAGDRVDYLFVITNAGTAVVSEVKIDDQFEGLTWTSPTSFEVLYPGESVRVTAQYTITDQDMWSGRLFNCADVTGSSGGSDGGSGSNFVGSPSVTRSRLGLQVEPNVFASDCVETPLEKAPALTVVKTGALVSGVEGDVVAGDSIDYTFEVTNSGNVPLTGITLTDLLPGMEWTSDHSIDALAPGETAILTGTYLITTEDIDAGSIENCVKAEGYSPRGGGQGMFLGNGTSLAQALHLQEDAPDVFGDDCVTNELVTEPEETPTPTPTVPVEETPTPTATLPVEETPTPTATVPAEETPTPMATVPAEETPTETATVPAEETPTETATVPIEETPAAAEGVRRLPSTGTGGAAMPTMVVWSVIGVLAIAGGMAIGSRRYGKR